MESKKILELAKNRGIELGEDVAQQLAKGGAHLIIDLLGELVKETENVVDDMAFASVESTARKIADEITVKL